MATDAQSLLAAASQYQGYAASGYQLGLMKVALLAQIAQQLNPMIATDPQSLLSAANCFQCYSAQPFMLQLMELALLAQIVNAGVAGGGFSCLVGIAGSGSPTQPAPCPTSIAYNEAGSFWWWQSTTSTWQVLPT